MLNYINKRKPDIVYVYNGRHALERPIIEACKKQKNFFLHTRIRAYNGGYLLFKNAPVQDHLEFLAQYYSCIQGASEKLIKRAGKVFYENNIGIRQGNISFNKRTLQFDNSKYLALDRHKKEKVLPKDWNKNKYNVVIFRVPNSKITLQRNFTIIEKFTKTQLTV